jgi:hypothetical protein
MYILGTVPELQAVRFGYVFRRKLHKVGGGALKEFNNYSLIFSLDINVDKLRARIFFQRDIRDCNILCFMETWLSRDILSGSVQKVEFSVHHADRNKYLSGKKKGGGVWFMIITHGVIVITQ